MPQLDQIDVQSFIGEFKALVEKPKGANAGKLNKSEIDAFRSPAITLAPVQEAHQSEQATRAMRNEYESKLIEKDSEKRRLEGVINAVPQRAIGVTTGHTTTTANPISSKRSRCG